MAVRLARQADRKALYTVAVSEFCRGLAQAFTLVAVNALLTELLAAGTLVDRLRGSVPALVLVSVLAVVSSLLESASTASTGVLEPKVQRVATERYLSLVARVEMDAIEDDAFHKLMDSAQWGADGARRMVGYCTAVVASAISLIAAGERTDRAALGTPAAAHRDGAAQRVGGADDGPGALRELAPLRPARTGGAADQSPADRPAGGG
ncbi:hypothetical protein SNARM312S_07504 [Streptomyces narbonensis]